MSINACRGTLSLVRFRPRLAPRAGPEIRQNPAQNRRKKRCRKSGPRDPKMEAPEVQKSIKNLRKWGPESRSENSAENNPLRPSKTMVSYCRGHTNHKIQGPGKRRRNDSKVPPKMDLKSIKTRPRNRTQKTPKKSRRKVRKTTAPGPQNGAQSPPKIVKKRSLGRVGGPPAPFGLKRWSRRGGTPQKRP